MPHPSHFTSAFYTLLVAFWIVPLASSLSSPRQVTPTTKYTYTGTQVFPTSTYYSTATAIINPLNYVITFPNAMNGTLYHSGMAIQSLYIQIPSKDFNLTFYWGTSMPKTSTSFNIKVWSNMVNKLQTLVMRYLVIDSNWGNFDFDWYRYGNIGTDISSSNSFTRSFSPLPTLNMSGPITIIACLTGFEATTATSTTQLSLILTVTRPTSTSLDFTISSLSASAVSLETVTFLAFFYNNGQINALPAKLTTGTFSASNNAVLKYTDTGTIVRQYNTFFGMQGFHIKNELFLSWDGTVTTNTSIAVTSSNNFLYFKFFYIIFQENWCIESNPYLILATSTCYDVCPDGYYPNNVGWTCEICLYDCFQCTNATACSTCDNTTDFRQMNATTSRCSPLPGYYDDGLSHAIALGCSTNCLTCVTTNIKCQSCNPGNYLNSSFSCMPCTDPNCNNCTTSINCLGCAIPYSLTGSTCIVNCSQAIGNCSTCSVNLGTISCDSCVLGFYLNITANNCTIICGDGILASTEACDDGNKADGDGCSSICMIQTSHFCTGAIGSQSSCPSCSSNCLNCSSATNCSLCQTNYITNPTNQCIANCALVTNCVTCSVASSTVVCSGCISGYMVDASNTCATVCGDGIIVGSEQCDDNNTANGDGCSSVCAVESTFYCVGTPSVCSHCLQYCVSCVSGTTCNSCSSITIWNPSTAICFANCSSISYCSTCTVSSSASGDYIQCLTCSGGYSVDATVNQCLPICGDGMLAPEEQCEDANLVNGDGCDSTCKVQQYYSCNVSTTTHLSLCFLSQLNISLVQITKSNTQNSGVMVFQPSPASLPLYSSINWTSVIKAPNSSVTVNSATYDPTTNQITVDFNYSSSIQASDIQLEVNTGVSPQLMGVSPFNVSLKAQSDDNKALVYYSDSEYALGNIIKYLAITAAACAVLFLIAGIVGGRIIGLQCAGVIQLSFISTLTLENLSPTFSCLQTLAYSLGYNKLKSYDYTQTIDRPLKSAQISTKFTNNFNFMGVLILLPVILALICKIISKVTKDQQKSQNWSKRSKHLIGQFTLYALLSFSYLAFLSLFIQVKYMSSVAADPMGLAIGAIILVAALFYLFFYAKADTFYTEFKQKFQADAFSSRFYVFFILQRIIVPATLIQLGSKVYTTGIVIGVYILLLILVAVKKPYKGHRQNIRPIANCIIVIFVEGIYLMVNFQQNPTGMFSIYGPLIVLALLLVCVAYSGYALIKQLKSSFNQAKSDISSKNQAKKFQELQMRQFTAKMLDQNKSILDNSSFLQDRTRKESDANFVDEDSPRKLNLTNVKQQLSALKKTNHQNKSLLDEKVQAQNLSKVLEEMQMDI